MPSSRSKANPLRYDPTRTATLRRTAEQAISARFLRLRAAVVRLIEEEDAFGIRADKRGPLAPTALNQQKYGAVLAPLRADFVRQELEKLQAQLDPRDILKLEDDPHVTVRYGFTEGSEQRVKELLNGKRKLYLRVGSLSLFSNPGEDVLKFEIESGELESLNRETGLLPNVSTHREYLPHLTVAYLKPGTGDKYLQLVSWLKGTGLYVNELIVSDKEKNKQTLALNTRFRFLSTQEKVKAFKLWLATKFAEILGTTEEGEVEDAYWNKYVMEGFRKGQGRAFDEVRKAGIQGESVRDFYNGSRTEFLRSSFNRPETVEKTKLLASRTFTDLKGITDSMSTRLSQSLTDGLVRGANPREIARDVAKGVDVGRKRALVIARTEIIRAHAEGQLEALERLGVEEIGVQVEWSTTGDSKVCPKCAALEGIVVKTKEAHGMLPRHPNCRCAFIPAGLGEKSDKQKKTKAAIQEAINRSIKAEIPRKSKRSLAEQKKRTTWTGADAKISKARPKSLV